MILIECSKCLFFLAFELTGADVGLPSWPTDHQNLDSISAGTRFSKMTTWDTKVSTAVCWGSLGLVVGVIWGLIGRLPVASGASPRLFQSSETMVAPPGPHLAPGGLSNPQQLHERPLGQADGLTR